MAPPVEAGEERQANIAAKIQQLARRMAVWKGQNTSTTKFLALQRARPFSEAEPAVKTRMIKYEALFAEFEELMDELDELDPEGEHHNPTERYEIEATHYSVLAEAQHIMNGEQPTNRTTVNPSPDPSTSSSSGTTRRRIKLPESKLPSFEGDHTQWLSFKTEFDSMIDSQLDLSDTDKLHYLRSALKGDALRKVQMLPITEDNYKKTREMLETAYSDKRVIVSRHLHCLIHLPKQEREDSQGLWKLVDHTRQHLESLRAMKVTTIDEMVVALLEDKMHRSTSDAWDDRQVRGVLPKLEDLFEFLARRATRLMNRPRERATQSTTANTPARGKKDGKQERQSAQTFVTSAPATCTICKEAPHPVYRCGKFLRYTIPQRIKALQDSGACKKCLRQGHSIEQCKFQDCKTCGEPHNSLLHPPAAVQQEPAQGAAATVSN